MAYSHDATKCVWCGASMNPSKAIHVSIGLLGFRGEGYVCSERCKKEFKASKGK